MLRHIEDFGKYINITGFEDVKIRDVEAFLKKVQREKPKNIEIQFFDGEYIATWQHLYFAVLNGLMAFKNHKNISKSLAMETMLYASTQRQIRKATNFLGIKPFRSRVALLIIGEEAESINPTLKMVAKHVQAKPNDSVLELSEEKIKLIQRAFKISKIEIQTTIKKDEIKEGLFDLILERMAILTTLL